MQEKLVEFAHLLRENGVRVSLAETLDAFSASQVTGLGERDAFRAALRTTMVKRSTELPVFEELFDIYFSGLGEIIKQASQAVQNALSMSDQEFQKFLDEVTEMLKKEGKNLSEMAKQLLRNNSGELERKINEAARAVKLSGIERTIEENYFARALARQLGLDKIEAEIKNLREQLEKMDVSSELKAKLEEYLERRLKALEDIIRRFVRMEREKRDIKQKDDQKLNQIGEKSFYYLTEEELKKMNEAVTRLAQRLKNVITVRRKRAKKGRFDIKRTLRQNMDCGGVPFKLRFEKRKREKPQVVILCDVSDSVRNASRFMLQFVYSLQDLYSRVRSFIFVADIGEVTDHFRNNDSKEALDVALKGDIINVYAHSNFGYAFRSFVSDHIGAVNKRTTVIVLGDARNNYNLPHDWCLREIQQRAKKVIWLNPESRNTWGFGDSEMDRYAPHCDVVEECRNLNQLYRVIDRLVTG
ncbi:MAG: VWA domain-containing protein [Candidatus Binatus sp.]|uniref:vWA domain-containing protein n=1 Tax=Candidatus Binatus sp. TaxID=2811406 RepID=UPI0027189600|nr:VWA domain-containing protein [Candidatus Binatus sp.]MDO8433192.1 VWA domain-containing protein [Candidatus Binatus sp.]